MYPDLPLRPFYLVRHGESESNRLGIAAGWVDTPLTDTGRAQAQALADCIAGVSPPPERLVCSPLARARDTGLILNDVLKLPVSFHEGLKERNFGLWAGQPAGPVFEKINRGEVPPEGEGLPDFTRRIFAALGDVLATGGRPLIAAHGGVFDALAYRYGRVIADIGNCGLYGFEPDATQDFPWRLYGYQKKGQGLVATPADDLISRV